MADTTYATVADVQAFFAANWLTIGASSEPNTTTVQTWLNQYAAQIDAELDCAGYPTIPTTGANDLLLIAPILAGRVAYDAWHKKASTQKEPAHVLGWKTTWEKWLAGLCTGDSRLRDQDATDAGTIGTIRVGLYGRSTD